MNSREEKEKETKIGVYTILLVVIKNLINQKHARKFFFEEAKLVSRVSRLSNSL
jgi:hypothetical protein